MKICFVINTLNVGGAAKMLKFVANTLNSNGHSVEIASLFASNPEQKDLNSSICVHNLGVTKAGYLGRMTAVLKLRQYFNANAKYDIICSFISDVALTSRLATLGMKNTKIVSAERGDPYSLTFPWNKLVRWAYRTSDYCFFQLPKARDYFDSQTIKHSFVIPNVFEPKEDLPQHIGERNKTIVSAGRFAAEKRFEVLLEAYKIVKEKHPDYSLTIYGEGNFLPKYREIVENLQLENVSFPGYVSNVAKSIMHDGVFVLPSRYEGIPNSLMEALSVGIPCVSTDCSPGGPRFLTKNGTTGILVPVNDVKAMAEAINKVIETPELAKSLEQNGPTILEDLTKVRIEEMWLDAFEKILND